MIRNETISFLCGINNLCSRFSLDPHAGGYFIIALEDSIESGVDSEYYGGEIGVANDWGTGRGETSIF